jgi:hypothetical protein
VITGLLLAWLIVIVVVITAAYAKQKEGNSTMILKVIYTFFIGIFLATLIGVGISAFYPEPSYPDMPPVLKYGLVEGVKDAEQYEEFKAEAEQFDQIEKEYSARSKLYNRNVSIISVVSAIVIVILSLTLFKTILVIADGLLLGGVLTLVYSVIRGFGTDDNVFRFIVVCIGFVTSIVLGYIKFIKPISQHMKV